MDLVFIDVRLVIVVSINIFLVFLFLCIYFCFVFVFNIVTGLYVSKFYQMYMYEILG